MVSRTYEPLKSRTENNFYSNYSDNAYIDKKTPERERSAKKNRSARKKEERRHDASELPQKINDSYTSYTSNHRNSLKNNENIPPNYETISNIQTVIDRVDSYLKENYNSNSTKYSSQKKHEDIADKTFIYFVDSGKHTRLTVPSIRLFEYDKKDDSTAYYTPPYNINNESRYKSFNIGNESYVQDRSFGERGSIKNYSFESATDYKRPGPTPVRSPERGNETFGRRSSTASRRPSEMKPKEQGNILAYDDYRVSNRNENSSVKKKPLHSRHHSLEKVDRGSFGRRSRTNSLDRQEGSLERQKSAKKRPQTALSAAKRRTTTTTNKPLKTLQGEEKGEPKYKKNYLQVTKEKDRQEK